MIHPISVVVYPLFGGWRAECQACGAYGNSEASKYKSNIAVALDNLSKNQNAYSEKSKTCEHHYGSYKPRVTCYIDYNNLQFIKDSYTTQGDENFPRVLIDTRFNLEVFNAKNLTHEWSAYSRVRYTQKQELQEQLSRETQRRKEKFIAETNAAFTDLLNKAAQTIDTKVAQHSIPAWQYVLYVCMASISVLFLSLLFGAAANIGGCREFLLKLSEACIYGLCL
jgi:hypothetical protein